jgi:hypothetical protein
MRATGNAVSPELVDIFRTIVREELAAGPRLPLVWLKERDAEKYLGFQNGTLSQYRRLGKPAPLSHGQHKQRRYHIQDLDAFVRSGFTCPKAVA